MTDKEIKEKYLRAPSVKEMLDFVKECDVSYAQFERFFGLYEGCIRRVKYGDKKLSVKFWPIFYEKTVPQYGINYTPKEKKVKFVPKKVQKTTLSGDHSRLQLLD